MLYWQCKFKSDQNYQPFVLINKIIIRITPCKLEQELPSTELTTYSVWKTKPDFKLPPTWAKNHSCSHTVHCDAPMETRNCYFKSQFLSNYRKSLGDMSKEMLKSHDGSKLRQLEELSCRSGYSLHGVFSHVIAPNLFSFLLVITEYSHPSYYSKYSQLLHIKLSTICRDRNKIFTSPNCVKKM